MINILFWKAWNHSVGVKIKTKMFYADNSTHQFWMCVKKPANSLQAPVEFSLVSLTGELVNVRFRFFFTFVNKVGKSLMFH